MAQGQKDSIGQAVGEAVDKALAQGKDVASEQVEQVQEELAEDVQELAPAALLFGVSGVLGMVGIAALGISVSKVLFKHPFVSAVLALGFIGGAAFVGIAGAEALPDQPFQNVKEHAKEQLAPLVE